MAISIDLKGRVVLICGVSRGGIGGGTARQAAAAGATVFAVDQTQDVLDRTLAEIAAAGGRCEGYVADLRDPAQSDRIVPTVIERLGRLDGVANVAGGTQEQEWLRLEETPTSVFRDVLNLNLEYVFRICRDAAAHWIRRRSPGALVNVGSISALSSAPFHGPYGAAKSAISALTRTMAVEWKAQGIRANTVSPGAVATERVTSRPGWGKNSGAANLTPVDAVANAIVFLLSDLALGISGQTLVVDSALSANFCAGSLEQMSASLYKAP